MKGIGTRGFDRSCSCICELDVRILNLLNRISTSQVMVQFLGLFKHRFQDCPDLKLSTVKSHFFLVMDKGRSSLKASMAYVETT